MPWAKFKKCEMFQNKFPASLRNKQCDQREGEGPGARLLGKGEQEHALTHCAVQHSRAKKNSEQVRHLKAIKQLEVTAKVIKHK